MNASVGVTMSGRKYSMQECISTNRVIFIPVPIKSSVVMSIKEVDFRSSSSDVWMSSEELK